MSTSTSVNCSSTSTTNGLFHGLVFHVSGVLSVRQIDMVQLLTKHGGYVVGQVSNKVMIIRSGRVSHLTHFTQTTHLISDQRSANSRTVAVTRAITLGVRIVNEHFVHDSITNGRLSDESSYALIIPPPTSSSGDDETDQDNQFLEAQTESQLSMAATILMLQDQLEAQAELLEEKDRTIETLRKELNSRRDKRKRVERDHCEEPKQKSPRLSADLGEPTCVFYCSQRNNDLKTWQIYSEEKGSHISMVTSGICIQPISHICYTNQAQMDTLGLLCKIEQYLTDCSDLESFPKWYPFMMVSQFFTDKPMNTSDRIVELFKSSLVTPDEWKPDFQFITGKKYFFITETGTPVAQTHLDRLFKATEALKRHCDCLFEITFPQSYLQYPQFIGGISKDDPNLLLGMFRTCCHSKGNVL